MKIIMADRRPTEKALEIAPGTWRVDDDAAKLSVDAEVVDGTTARDAVPARTDLPAGHWLSGYRAACTVWSGEPDQIVGEDGLLYPVGSREELTRLEKDGLVKRVAEAGEIEVVR